MKRRLEYDNQIEDVNSVNNVVSQAIISMLNKNTRKALKLLANINPSTNINDIINHPENVWRLYNFSQEIRDCYTFSELAALLGQLNIYKFLESNPAFNSITYPYRHPLHHAALGGHVNMCAYLITQGCNIDVKCVKSNRTPLSYIIAYAPDDISEEFLGTIKFFLANDANPELKDLEKKSALDYALEKENLNIIECFEEYLKKGIAEGKSYISMYSPNISVCQYLIALGDKITKETFLRYYETGAPKQWFDWVLQNYIKEADIRNELLETIYKKTNRNVDAVSVLIESGATVGEVQDFEFVTDPDDYNSAISPKAIFIIFNRMSLSGVDIVPLDNWTSSLGGYNAWIAQLLLSYGAKPIENKFLRNCNPKCLDFFIQTCAYRDVLQNAAREKEFIVAVNSKLKNILIGYLLHLPILNNELSSEEQITENETKFNYTLEELRSAIESVAKNHTNTLFYTHASFIYKNPFITAQQALNIFCDFNRINALTISMSYTCKSFYAFDPGAVFNITNDPCKIIYTELLGELRNPTSFEKFVSMRQEHVKELFSSKTT